MVLFTASYYFKQMLGKIISCHKRDHCLFKTLPQIKYYAHRNLFESIVCFYEKLFMMHNYFLIEYGSKMFTFLIFMFIKNGRPLYRTFCDEESQCLSPICCCSVTQSCLTLCYPMDCGMPGFLALHHLLELTQTHVH